MQRLEIKNQIQLAHILKQAVQRLDEHLDQIQQRKRGLGGCADQDEVEGGVVAVGDEGGGVVVGVGGGGRRGEERGEGEEVAGGGGAVGDEGEDFGDEALLDGGVLLVGGVLVGGRGGENVGGGGGGGGGYELGVEFCEARLAGVVEDEDGVDHGGCLVGLEMGG